MSIGKKVGIVASKTLKATNLITKKIEVCSSSIAKKNNNKYADKISDAMSRFSEKIEANHDKCVLSVEKKTDEFVELTKKVFGKVEKICNEMKTRADIAKSKAEKDAKADVVEVNEKNVSSDKVDENDSSSDKTGE